MPPLGRSAPAGAPDGPVDEMIRLCLDVRRGIIAPIASFAKTFSDDKMHTNRHDFDTGRTEPSHRRTVKAQTDTTSPFSLTSRYLCSFGPFRESPATAASTAEAEVSPSTPTMESRLRFFLLPFSPLRSEV